MALTDAKAKNAKLEAGKKPSSPTVVGFIYWLSQAVSIGGLIIVFVEKGKRYLLAFIQRYRASTRSKGRR